MQILKVFGPPGTGKTTRMLRVMEQELKAGIHPERLAYLTFTVQARREAMGRAMGLFNLTEEQLPNFRTLHAICYRELNMTVGGMVKGNRDLQVLSESLGVSFSARQQHRDDDMLDFPAGGEVGDRLLQLDHLRRHRLQTVEEAWRGRFDDDLSIFMVRRFVAAYEGWKTQEGLRDFTDLLEQAEDPLDVDVVIVDEAQDLSRLQWQTLHKLVVNARRLYIAGDDDQAIFTWAGADPQAFVDHPGAVEVLAHSYRLPEAVYQLANRLSDRILHRQPKKWASRGVAGRVTYRNTADTLRLDPGGTWLFLYRHHYLVSDLEALVRLRGLPYVRNDRPAPGAEWGEAIIYWERLRKGRELTWSQTKAALDGLSIGHGMKKEGRQLLLSSDKKLAYTMSSLLEYYGLMTTEPWYNALTKILPADTQYLRSIISKQGVRALTESPKIRLSTIHAAKGAEADHVVLLTDMSRRVKDNLELNPDDERRVFYVGVTRAKEDLTVVGVDNPLFP